MAPGGTTKAQDYLKKPQHGPKPAPRRPRCDTKRTGQLTQKQGQLSRAVGCSKRPPRSPLPLPVLLGWSSVAVEVLPFGLSRTTRSPSEICPIWFGSLVPKGPKMSQANRFPHLYVVSFEVSQLFPLFFLRNSCSQLFVAFLRPMPLYRAQRGPQIGQKSSN